MLKQIIGQQSESERDKDAKASPSSSKPQSKKNPTSSSISMSSSKNVLSSDVEIKGSIKFSHDLIIDGTIEGEVMSDGNLTIGENADIKGEIRTKSVVVFGKVNGNITVEESCELKQNAELVGDVQAGTLSIEPGATFMGQSSVGKGLTAVKSAASSGAGGSGDSKKAGAA